MGAVIVGASAAGIRTAQALRTGGYTSSIVVIGEEQHQPYDKPPLSKELLDSSGNAAAVPILRPDELLELDLDLRLGVRATGVDTTRRTVSTADGQDVPYRELVVATGVEPRTLAGAERLAGVHVLRTADDALALRNGLGTAAHVVIIGAGFIGAEIASAARARGLDVTIVEALETPMSGVLGDTVGRLLASLHLLNGAQLITGTGVAGFIGDDHVTGVELADGRVLRADLVVVGIGTIPATAWLRGSGIPIPNGVECDAQLRISGHPDSYAAGDVARFPHPLFGLDVRIEHWTNANEHAAIVAAGILKQPVPPATVPYVWSDQYGHRIQIVGRPSAGNLHSLGGEMTREHPLTAIYASDAGTVVGAVVLNSPRTMMRLRRVIAARGDVAEVDADPAISAQRLSVLN